MKRIIVLTLILLSPGCATMKMDTKLLEKTATFSPQVEDKEVQIVKRFKRSGRVGRVLFTIIPVFQPNLDGMLREELKKAKADAIVNLEIETKYRFLDILVNALAGGIFYMRSSIVKGDLGVFVEPGQVVSRPTLLEDERGGKTRKGFFVAYSPGFSDYDNSGIGITYQYERYLDAEHLFALTINPGYMSYDNELKVVPVRFGLKLNGSQLEPIEANLAGLNPFFEGGFGYYLWTRGDLIDDNWELGDFGYFFGGGIDCPITPNMLAAFRVQRNVIRVDEFNIEYDPFTQSYIEESLDFKDWQFGFGLSWIR